MKYLNLYASHFLNFSELAIFFSATNRGGTCKVLKKNTKKDERSDQWLASTCVAEPADRLLASGIKGLTRGNIRNPLAGPREDVRRGNAPFQIGTFSRSQHSRTGARVAAYAVALCLSFLALFSATASAQVTSSAAPAFSPAAGAYASAQTVTISTITPSATIYYTTNGTTPTANSTVYSGPITVSSSTIVEAIAVSAGLANSAVSSSNYTIGTLAGASCSAMSLGNGASLNGFVPFPSNNAWNTNIVSAPVDPNSSAIIGGSGFAGWYLFPNFGSASSDGGIPYVVVDSTSTPTVPINVIDFASQSDVVVAPLPITAPIEGNAADCSGWPDVNNGDAHVLVLDRAKCELFRPITPIAAAGTGTPRARQFGTCTTPSRGLLAGRQRTPPDWPYFQGWSATTK